MLIGRFYFKRTATGNLLGEYSHRRSDPRLVYAEAATRTSEGRGWEGTYRTVWREGPNFTPVFARLEIRQAEGSTALFKVEWFDEASAARRIFEGEAMECDGNLIGDYTLNEK